jgi:hypothetical protein
MMEVKEVKGVKEVVCLLLLCTVNSILNNNICVCNVTELVVG